jgi:hypothetical protein
MRLARWLALGLVAGLLSGCSADRAPAPGEGGGGGGPAASPIQSEDEALRTRDYAGNAYLASARAHRSLALGDYRVARGDLVDVGRQLDFAAASASPEQRTEIALVKEKLEALKAAVVRHDPRAVADSRALTQGLLWLFDTYAGFTPGGGGGGAVRPKPRHEGPTAPM